MPKESFNPGGFEKGKPEEVENKERVDFVKSELGDSSGEFRDLMINKLSFSEITSILGDVYNEKIKKLTPGEVLDNYKENRFLSPSTIDVKKLLSVDSTLVDNLPTEFETIQLSPLAPVGATSLLTRINSRTVLQTIRSAEVLADSSIVMALESAARRKDILKRREESSKVNLASSERELRLQAFPQKHLKPHFSSFTITTAGKDTGRNSFENKTLDTHLRYWLSSIAVLNEGGYDIKNINIQISDIRIIEHLISLGILEREKVASSTRQKGIDLFREAGLDIPSRTDDILGMKDPAGNDLKPLVMPIRNLQGIEKTYLNDLRVEYPEVRFSYDLGRIQGIGYHNGVCFKVKATNSDGIEMSLIDGGASDWTQKLLSDSKERFFGSGFGTEVLVNNFSKKE